MNNRRIRSILAVGDCNTLGAGELRNRAYPERLAKLTGAAVKNCGYTMSTTREGIHLLQDNLREEHECVIIQFGLVDAYSTFQYAPYVKYYPDNIFRKQLRSLVKKYKKICRKRGLNERFGEISVVPELEYEENLRCMVRNCKDKMVLLPETIPNHQRERNPAIRRYNEIVAKISSEENNCSFLPVYDEFLCNMDNFYSDGTHANGPGYDFIARGLNDLIGKLT